MGFLDLRHQQVPLAACGYKLKRPPAREATAGALNLLIQQRLVFLWLLLFSIMGSLTILIGSVSYEYQSQCKHKQSSDFSQTNLPHLGHARHTNLAVRSAALVGGHWPPGSLLLLRQCDAADMPHFPWRTGGSAAPNLLGLASSDQRSWWVALAALQWPFSRKTAAIVSPEVKCTQLDLRSDSHADSIVPLYPWICKFRSLRQTWNRSFKRGLILFTKAVLHFRSLCWIPHQKNEEVYLCCGSKLRNSGEHPV